MFLVSSISLHQLLRCQHPTMTNYT